MAIEASDWATLYFLSEWAVRLAMLAVVPMRRTPDAARGWLVLLFFLPWPGLVLYLLIGRARYPKWREERLATLPRLLEPALNRLHAMPHATRPEVPEGLEQQYVTLATRLGHLPILSGNSAIAVRL